MLHLCLKKVCGHLLTQNGKNIGSVHTLCRGLASGGSPDEYKPDADAIAPSGYPIRELPDPIETATGPEKAELLAKMIGDEHRYEPKVFAITKASKQNPNLVPTYYNSRLIVCTCHKDAFGVRGTWVTLGEEPKRCYCGNWFKAVPVPEDTDFLE